MLSPHPAFDPSLKPSPQMASQTSSSTSSSALTSEQDALKQAFQEQNPHVPFDLGQETLLKLSPRFFASTLRLRDVPRRHGYLSPKVCAVLSGPYSIHGSFFRGYCTRSFEGDYALRGRPQVLSPGCSPSYVGARHACLSCLSLHDSTGTLRSQACFFFSSPQDVISRDSSKGSPNNYGCVKVSIVYAIYQRIPLRAQTPSWPASTRDLYFPRFCQDTVPPPFLPLKDIVTPFASLSLTQSQHVSFS